MVKDTDRRVDSGQGETEGKGDGNGRRVLVASKLTNAYLLRILDGSSVSGYRAVSELTVLETSRSNLSASQGQPGLS